tara:strand:- start:1994 stop:2776 length:783 start_codon:yes stop_codon:yes gene_type:complete
MVLIIGCSVLVNAQDPLEESIFEKPTSELWLGGYGKFRLTEKLFWSGELHLRTSSTKETPMVGYLSKIYNRHGIKYVHSKKFSATLGGVLRLNLSQYDGPEYQRLALEPRIWHQYIFAMPFDRFMVYHRIRIEHRWSKPNLTDAEFIYRNRYRYMIQAKIPINKKKLVPGAYYFSPYVELIMQSGKTIVGNPMEDLRIYPHVGYILNPRVAFSVGMLYTTGQTSANGQYYRRRWIPRINTYISLDFRKEKFKIPEINTYD